MEYKQIGEGFVFTAENWENCRYGNIIKGTVKIYFLDEDGNEAIVFTEGKDYAVNYTDGAIKRTEISRIPDFSLSAFYGLSAFNHVLFEKWGNSDFTVYCSYLCNITANESNEAIAAQLSEANGNNGIMETYLKNFKGKKLRYMVFGDSISFGCEATPTINSYSSRFLAYIKNKYSIEVEVVNKAVCGDSLIEGSSRFAKDILVDEFDVISIAFGMNDQNSDNGKLTVEPSVFGKKIEQMVSEILKKNQTQVILVSPCYPHTRWIHTSGRTQEYADVLNNISKKSGVYFADVSALWKNELAHKSQDCLLRNGINHPNNYGHYLYSLILNSLC